MQEILKEILGPAGALVLTLVVLFGGFKKNPWWVFGWTYREVVKEKDEWKHAALRGITTAERVTTLAEKSSNDTPP